MTEERKHAILLAATILLAGKLQPTLEDETPDLVIEHYRGGRSTRPLASSKRLTQSGLPKRIRWQQVR
jgi:hypothetical protein